MAQFGFSTGAIALSDFHRALNVLQATDTNAIELSALRFPELRPLLDELPHLDLSKYSYVSIHVPSVFSSVEERAVVNQIAAGITFRPLPVIVHPDSIHDFDLWSDLGNIVCIENMDSRKRTGRTAAELARFFERLPQARFCLDVAHARQLDTSMVESYLMLERFADRVVQVHLSEINAASKHMPMSEASVSAYQMISSLIPKGAAVIVESRLDDDPSPERIERETAKGRRAFPWLAGQTVAA
jgi:hypothetical protein